MARVLVTYGWCRTAYVVAKSLARAGHTVFSCSHLRPSMTAWSRFCKASDVTADPFEDEKAFLADINELVRKWDIDVIFPGHEDALVLRQFEDEFPAAVKLACPSLEELRTGVDKLTITRIAERAEVPAPLTLEPEKDGVEAAATRIGYPVIFKLSRSNSAKGVFMLKNEEALVDFLDSEQGLRALESDFFLQRYHAGPVVGICFMAIAGRIQGSFAEQYVRAKSGGFGTSVFRAPFYSDKLDEYAAKIVEATGWTGIGHFDFIQVEGGKDFVLLEMNPRPWGAINLAYINGYDFPAALVAHTLGDKDLSQFLKGHGTGEGKRCLWLVGESIRFVSLLTKKDFKAGAKFPLEMMSSLKGTEFDDFLFSDPLPLLAEYLCYGKGFVVSGGSVNPD